MKLLLATLLTLFFSSSLLAEGLDVNDLVEGAGDPPCHNCEVFGLNNNDDGLIISTKGSLAPKYNLDNEKQRKALIQQIMKAGKKRHAKTTMNLPGGKFEVFNDALKLPDGTYVNFKYEEAVAIAKAWGCQLPNLDQANAIRNYAEKQGATFKARTRKPANNETIKYQEMENMMNDPKMREYSQRGNKKLINGHFKWYIDRGNNKFRFYGFYAPPSCFGSSRTSYCQNGGSGGHDNDWIDYSQSVRLICKK